MGKPRFRVSLRSPYPLLKDVIWTHYDGHIMIAMNSTAAKLLLRYKIRLGELHGMD